MIQSGGVLLKTPSVTIWQGRPDQWNLDLGFRWASYGAIYRSHLWVAALVNKLAFATARLPLKIYERAEKGRPEADGHPYAALLRRPSNTVDPFFFWLWTKATLDTYGEAFWGKIRDRGGRPVELVRLHPTNVYDDDGRWWYDNGKRRIDKIDRRDLVHFREYNPGSDVRGLSRLEPLRSTLENEEGARKANSALWRNGGRPSVFLRTDRTLSQPAQERLAANWSALHGGVDNWAKAAVLEEGMEAQTISLNAEELQYVESRKLNREEACAIFDVPPPVVHILDRATFSNITEQMRSMYRDTMAPRLKLLESALEFQLRDGRFEQQADPDFGDGVYAEFLMDEVLRGDFEVRADAYQKAINSGWMQPSEVREKENLPYVEGSDVLLVNSTLVPLGAEPVDEPAGELAEVVPLQAVRTVMGRLSRQKDLAGVDADRLVAGLNGDGDTIRRRLEEAQAGGLTVEEFRAVLKELSVAEAVRHSDETAALRAELSRLRAGTVRQVVRDDNGLIERIVESCGNPG